MDSRRSCFIANLMNIECDSKKADLNETYNEQKKKNCCSESDMESWNEK